jgi:hypothetical protein
MRLLLIVGGVLIAIITCGASARNGANRTSLPLTATAVLPGENDFATCTNAGIDGNVVGLSILYTGHQALRAYVIAVYYPHSVPGTRDYTTDRKLVYPDQPLIQPGSFWHSTICGLPPYANYTNVTTESDLLIFKDGSAVGPVSVPESSHFYGVTEGMLIADGQPNAAHTVRPTQLISGEFGTPVNDGNDSLPLRMTATVERNKENQAKVTIAATNVGSSAVVGYEFKLSYYDHATGAFVRSVTTKTLATTNDASAFLLPGATWSSAPRRVDISSDGQLDTFKVSLDTVALADGTVVGPRRSRESDELLGMIEGIEIESSLPRSLRK